MALSGTAGTSLEGDTLYRKFTTIRSDGSYNICEASMKQDHMHEIYRKYFNTLDKHNSLHQGAACFEQTWKTHRWWIQEFQMLWGITEVNAWLLYKIYTHGGDNLSFSAFRRRLCGQMLEHPTIARDGALRARASDGGVNYSHRLESLGTAPAGHRI